MAKATKKDQTNLAPLITLSPTPASLGRLQLSEAVAMQLREDILSGKLKQGDFLRIDAIAQALGVSTTPVREGLLLLQSESFVRLIPRRGFIVHSFSKDDLLDLFWSQAVIAGELAARAAKRISPAEFEALERINHEHEEAFASQDPRVARSGHNFHRAINLAARSPRLAQLLGSLTRQLPNRFYASIDGQQKDGIECHPRILAAFRAGDAEKARTLMHKHIYAGGEHLVLMLERQGMWASDTETKRVRKASRQQKGGLLGFRDEGGPASQRGRGAV